MSNISKNENISEFKEKILFPSQSIVGICNEISRNFEDLSKETFEDIQQILSSSNKLVSLIEHYNDDMKAQDIGDFDFQKIRHDIKNPINVVLGCSKLVLEDSQDSDEELSVLLKQIIDISNDLTVEVDALIRSETYEQKDKTQKTSLADLFSSIDVSEFRHDFNERLLGKRILIVDDDRINRGIFKRRLMQRGYDVYEKDSGANALNFLMNNEVDLILLDLLMPDINGIEVLSKLRSSDTLNNIPVIIISGLDDPRSIVSCLRNGANDYLAKPVELSVLEIKVASVLEKQILQDDLFRLANTDQLTGISNRRKIIDDLKTYDNQLKMHEQAYAVAIFDIDHFKLINDTFGHDAGDEAIKFVAETISANVRKEDLVGRLGGEEFLCACQPISIDDMTIICERIRTSVEKAELQIDNAQISMTISAGIAHSKNMSGDYSTYLTFADEKLYEAKNGGRNRIIL